MWFLTLRRKDPSLSVLGDAEDAAIRGSLLAQQAARSWAVFEQVHPVQPRKAGPCTSYVEVAYQEEAEKPQLAGR
jgi:hypothetical protein